MAKSSVLTGIEPPVAKLGLVLVLVLALTGTALAQPSPVRNRQYPPGSLVGVTDLPESRFRSQLEALPDAARERALGWLRQFHFTELDLGSLQVDSEGGVFYADTFTLAPVPAAESSPSISATAVPVTPFPTNLVFHSRRGAPNVLFLNFSGENVSGTAWNTSLSRTPIPAVVFSTDSDFTTFSDAEQLAIKRIWQRVAEDYAPFNVDVTTERPATFTTRTGHALITRNTDANDQPNPSSTAGGVGYVGVFGSSSYANYRPVWIYYNNLANAESYIAEAVSHELGHNLGLSHDGKTDGTEYYGGHGTGDISWGPLMGTGYNRNVSQWSKGEYYLANNTEDDLAIIAGLLAYRADDHGNTIASATALTITQGTNIVSTTPENDPSNTNRVNKGVIERSSDVDVFSFATGNGAINITVNPWIEPNALTRGGNLDIVAELYDASGTLLLTNNGASVTYVRLQTNLVEGLYYLLVRATGTGTPLSSTPSGYTAYASLGQYFISGTVVASSFVIPPHAELVATGVTLPGTGPLNLTVNYTDNQAIDVTTIDSNDLRVTGTGGYDRPARLASFSPATNGTPVAAQYAVDPPTGGTWLSSDNGIYTVWMGTNQVGDTEGAWVAGGQLGQFTVNVPVAIYSADMTADPGWSLEPLWQYGQPAYTSGGPTNGATGQAIIAYNLSGTYEKNLPWKYATTPVINCTGANSLSLRFQRWLKTKKGATASIQVSTNGTVWVDIWNSAGKNVGDAAWQQMQYTLPSWTAGSPALRLRWGITSGAGPQDLGWNIDDVQVVAGGNLDTVPPSAFASVANLTMAGSPTHSFTVTYSDNTAVRVSTLSSSNIVALGPNNYSNYVAFVGVDAASDGSPRTASYSVPAPNGTWSAADNGTYQLVLLDGQVTDIYNNPIPETLLGSFAVAIVTNNPTPNFTLTATVNNPDWGSVSPSNGVYTAGSLVEIAATPAAWYRFAGWAGDASGTANPLVLTLNTNLFVEALFEEMLTTNQPTPLWWLAGYGYGPDFEAAVVMTGANGMQVWQSWIAGLNPTNSGSVLGLTIEPTVTPGSVVLSWNTVEGRLYTLESAESASGPFTAVPAATALAPSIRSLTNAITSSGLYYRLSVVKP